MTGLEKAISKVRADLDRLSKLEGALIRTRGGLDGLPGSAALDVAIEGLGHVRNAVDQAEHELEIEAGSYLAEPEPEPAPELEAEPEPDLPACRWCGSDEGTPHAWLCPKPRPEGR